MEDLRLREAVTNGISNLTIADEIWVMLYEAKCIDLGIPARSDKQLERFLSQMKLYQRDDKLTFRDQGMGCQAAAVLGHHILAGNENLQRLDLSNNQLQTNFRPIVEGLKANSRIISLTMRNN